MGCKQYARMLWLSIGYPYILYLSLNKWDATPEPGFSTPAPHPPRQGCSHAGISARAEMRRFKSEIERSRLIDLGQMSPAPMGT